MTFFKRVKAWVDRNIESQAPQQTYLVLPTRGKAKPIVSSEHYFRVWLKDMRLASTTRWFTDFYPATHSLTALQFGDSSLEIASLIGPRDFGAGINKSNLGNSVIVNKALTPLLPFKGGTVSLDAGLVSVPAEGGIGSFLNAVSRFAQMLDVPQVSSIVKLAEPVAASIADLLELNGPTVRLNYSSTYSATGGGRFEDAYFVIASLPNGKLRADHLWIVGDRVRVGNSAESSDPLDDCDYLLFHIERVDERDDWEQFADIAEPLQSALRAALTGNSEEMNFQLMTAKAKVIASPDLTQIDQYRVVRAIDKRVAELAKPQGPSAAADDLSLDPGEFAKELMRGAIPQAEARESLAASGEAMSAVWGE